jgi:photosystem II stability/assembly factor-like uncharacterized protein
MMQRIFLVCGLVMVPAICWGQELSWEKLAGIPQEAPFVALAVASDDPNVVAAATDKRIFVSSDSGKTWQPQNLLPANARLSAIAIQAKPETILAATDQGLYAAAGNEAGWTVAFKGIGQNARACTFAAFLPGAQNHALLGTRDGLFASQDGGRSWRELAIPIDAHEIIHASVDALGSNRAYLATTKGCFTGNLKTGGWRQILSTRTAEEMAGEGSETEQAGEDEDHLPVLRHFLRAVAVDPADADTLLLGTSHSVLMSSDGGSSWRSLPRAGLGSAAVLRLIAVRRSPLAVYAATERGIFRLQLGADSWQSLALGLTGGRARDLAHTARGVLAATDNGLLLSPIAVDPFTDPQPPSAQELLSNFVHEPSITQVRQAAIAYAEVHPDKIRRWRQQAAWKALLPSIDIGYDHDTSYDVHYDEGTFPNFQVIETQDRSRGLDLSVSWDLGDLIWNDDQTSIDTRSKLMVELRDDIVSEVTRVYFERRRLQTALLAAPPVDQKTSIEKELRIQELTALLDGLSGGYFSTHTTSPHTP